MANGYTAEEKEYNRLYYERNKKLKGREGGSSESAGISRASAPNVPPPADRQAARAAAAQRVSALKAKLTQLRSALAAAKKKSSSTAPKPGTPQAESKKKAENKEYYEKNKSRLASKAAARGKDGGSSSKSSSSSTSSGTRSVADIEAAIRTTLGELKTAIAKLQSL